MWYDDFDMDLAKVIPDAMQVIAPVANVKLVTHGKPDKEGKLNHPCVWNGFHLMAFFGLDREPQPFFKPDMYWTSDPLICCTFEEAVRDCWPHQYAIMVNGQMVWVPEPQDFEAIMFHVRGWDKDKLRDITPHVANTIKSLERARMRLSILNTPQPPAPKGKE
jgi:hypothetical protein